MKNDHIAKTSVTIKADTAAVWKAITSAGTIKKYLMDTNVKTDWKEGSPITYEGEYNGKTYKDKGVIKKIEKEKMLQSTYWSSMGGKEDKPENYNLVTYELESKDDNTLLKLRQDNIHSEKEQQQAIENWKAVLRKLKAVVEANENHPA
ncbi:MAG TPA: SRPBCC family protein [Chitinophagaceae bacterium]|nr:SRPBCC family protein [Chitinophagaceae bacterium]